MTRYVKAVYIDMVEVPDPANPAEPISLHVWQNPETGQCVAIDNMDLVVSTNSIPDPYLSDGTRLVFEATFSGLPK